MRPTKTLIRLRILRRYGSYRLKAKPFSDRAASQADLDLYRSSMLQGHIVLRVCLYSKVTRMSSVLLKCEFHRLDKRYFSQVLFSLDTQFFSETIFSHARQTMCKPINFL